MTDSTSWITPAMGDWDETTRRRASAALYVCMVLVVGTIIAVTKQFGSWRMPVWGGIIAVSVGAKMFVFPEWLRGTALAYGLVVGAIFASARWMAGAGIMDTIYTFSLLLSIGASRTAISQLRDAD